MVKSAEQAENLQTLTELVQTERDLDDIYLKQLRDKTINLFGSMEDQLNGADKFVISPDKTIVVKASSRKQN